jgi:hypothetical protein
MINNGNPNTLVKNIHSSIWQPLKAQNCKTVYSCHFCLFLSNTGSFMSDCTVFHTYESISVKNFIFILVGLGFVLRASLSPSGLSTA